MPSQITLLVPGLLGPFPGADDKVFPAPPVPGLRELLHAARPAPGGADDVDVWLCRRFGVQPSETGEWPLAPLLAELELGAAGQDYWLRADPVHLRADRSCLVLFGPEQLAIRQEEADALVDGFNALYQADGLKIHAPTPNRWYLRLARPARLATTPLPKVIGRSIDGVLPRGADAREWHARMNEIQMLFHAHAVNQQRAEQGQPVINSLWLWGGGRLPDALQAQDAWVYSDDPLTRSLARSAGVPLLEADGVPEDWLPTALARGSGLVVLDACLQAQRYGDTREWEGRLAELERKWFRPLQVMRAQGRLRELALLAPPATGYRIGAPRWWEGLRRSRPLRAFIQAA